MVKYDLKRVLPKKKKLPQTPPPTPPPCASVLKKSGICHNFQAHDCFFTDFFWTLPFQKLCMWIANVPLCKTQPEQIFTPKRGELNQIYCSADTHCKFDDFSEIWFCRTCNRRCFDFIFWYLDKNLEIFRFYILIFWYFFPVLNLRPATSKLGQLLVVQFTVQPAVKIC